MMKFILEVIGDELLKAVMRGLKRLAGRFNGR